MKYLVTGGNGALGFSLIKELEKREEEVLKCTRENINLEDRNLIFKTITNFKPDVIIHSAEYTQVDMCENMEEYAMKVNGYGTKNMVDAAMNGILETDEGRVEGTSIATGRMTATITECYLENNHLQNIHELL